MARTILLEIEEPRVVLIVPVVDNTQRKPARLIGEYQVYLSVVILVSDQPYIAPSRQAQSFPSYREFWLQRHMSQVESAPDVAADEVSLQTSLYLALCL